MLIVLWPNFSQETYLLQYLHQNLNQIKRPHETWCKRNWRTDAGASNTRFAKILKNIPSALFPPRQNTSDTQTFASKVSRISIYNDQQFCLQHIPHKLILDSGKSLVTFAASFFMPLTDNHRVRIIFTLSTERQAVI